MSMHLRNSRDMMTTDDAGWWVSKTPLEQKLIILSSILGILSFCLTISVIVLDNRKPPACGGSTTVAPSNDTSPTAATDKTEPTEPATEPDTGPTTEPNTETPKKPESAPKEILSEISMIIQEQNPGGMDDPTANGIPEQEALAYNSSEKDPSSRQL